VKRHKVYATLWTPSKRACAVVWNVFGPATMCYVYKIGGKQPIPVAAGLTRYNPKDKHDWRVGFRESARHACYEGLPGAPETAAPQNIRRELFSAIRKLIHERWELPAEANKTIAAAWCEASGIMEVT